MEFAVLGSLQVLGDAGDIAIGGAKERTVLANLVARVPRTVPPAELIDNLWGEDPPRSAHKSVQNLVLRLRKTLEPDRDGAPRLIVTDDGGYRLAVREDVIDAHRFARLVEHGRLRQREGRPDLAAAALTEALALWRGPAYLGFEGTGFGGGEARRLGELRSSALEDRVAAQLDLGKARDAVPELEALLHATPLRERLWELLVLALYRSDRQADALAAYARARDVLVEELGVEPGPALRALHSRVLAQDPTLDAGPLPRAAVRALVREHLDEETTERVLPEVLQRSAGIPSRVQPVVLEHVRAATEARIEQAATRAGEVQRELGRVQGLLRDDVLQLHGVLGHGEAVDPAGCPWKGLVAYDVDDAAWFAGRERLVAELVARLASSPVLAVVGSSGSGKSSLVRAGLLAALQAGALPGSGDWQRLVLRPGDHPLRELDKLVLAAPQTRVLLVVDQLEEVWTACADPAEREEFLDVVTEIAQAGSWVVVLVLRSDYVGEVADRPALGRLVSGATVLVGAPTQAELRRAVEHPAALAGLTLEVGLTDALIADTGDEPGSLPLLSTALAELWEHREGQALTLAAYARGGGVRGAIARIAERAYGSLNPGDRAATRVLLLRLTGPGDADAVTRRRVPLSELEALPDPAVRRVVEPLTAARLLTVSAGHVEVAHEALFREWPRLRGWLGEDAADRAVRQRWRRPLPSGTPGAGTPRTCGAGRGSWPRWSSRSGTAPS